MLQTLTGRISRSERQRPGCEGKRKVATTSDRRGLKVITPVFILQHGEPQLSVLERAAPHNPGNTIRASISRRNQEYERGTY